MQITNVSSVYYKDFKDKIIIKQGIWEKFEVELSKEEFENNNSSWEKFRKNFINIMTGKEYNCSYDDDYTKFIFRELISYEILSISGNKIFEFIEIEEFDIKKIKNKNIVIIADERNIDKIRKINRLLQEQNINWILGIIQYNFITIINFSNLDMGCFSCYEDSQISRIIDYFSIENEEDNSNYQISNINTSEVQKNFIISAIELTKNTFNSNSIISIYLPTFSFHKERVLKNPLCKVCSKNKINNKTSNFGFGINSFQGKNNESK